MVSQGVQMQNNLDEILLNILIRSIIRYFHFFITAKNRSSPTFSICAANLFVEHMCTKMYVPTCLNSLVMSVYILAIPKWNLLQFLFTPQSHVSESEFNSALNVQFIILLRLLFALAFQTSRTSFIARFYLISRCLIKSYAGLSWSYRPFIVPITSCATLYVTVLLLVFTPAFDVSSLTSKKLQLLDISYVRW